MLSSIVRLRRVLLPRLVAAACAWVDLASHACRAHTRDCHRAVTQLTTLSRPSSYGGSRVTIGDQRAGSAISVLAAYSALLRAECNPVAVPSDSRARVAAVLTTTTQYVRVSSFIQSSVLVYSHQRVFTASVYRVSSIDVSTIVYSTESTLISLQCPSPG